MSGSENVQSADKVSVTAVETKAPSNALDEVLDFCSQTVQHPEARIRQTGTVLQGIVVGGIKDIPNELMNHPLETCGKVAVATGVGIGAGALIGLEIPIVTGITIGAGVTMLGFGIADSVKRMSSDKQLQGALHNVWKSEDFYTQMQANDKAEKVLGPEAFNWGVTLPAALVGGVGGNLATKFVSAKLLSGKAIVAADTPEIVPMETSEIPYSDELTIVSQIESGNKIETTLSDGTKYITGPKTNDWEIQFPDGNGISKSGKERLTWADDRFDYKFRENLSTGEHVYVGSGGDVIRLNSAKQTQELIPCKTIDQQATERVAADGTGALAPRSRTMVEGESGFSQASMETGISVHKGTVEYNGGYFHYAKNGSEVIFDGPGAMVAESGSKVYTSSTVHALEGSTIYAKDGASVEAFAGSTIYAYGRVYVIANPGAKVFRGSEEVQIIRIGKDGRPVAEQEELTNAARQKAETDSAKTAEEGAGKEISTDHPPPQNGLAARMAKIKAHGEKIQNLTPDEKSAYYAERAARLEALDAANAPYVNALAELMSAYVRDDLAGMEAAKQKMDKILPPEEGAETETSSIRALDREYPMY